MPRETGRQKEIVGRVMHEFKHGELESRGRKVRNPRQAVAIGLSEAGASNRKSASENTRSRRRTEEKERKGQTARQQKEGRASVKPRGTAKSRVGTTSGKSKSARSTTRAPARGTARTTRTVSRAQSRGRAARGEPTRAQLYAETQRRGMSGCSRMSKADLERALRRH